MPRPRGRPPTKGPRRATTVYLDPELAKAAKLKGVATGFSLSDQVNDALAKALRQDERHLRLFEARRGERVYSYDEFVARLKRDGKI